MQTLILFSVYDTVSETFNKPFVAINNNSAIRAFTDSGEKEPHINDYVLYRIAEMNDQTGEVKPEEHGPVKILTGFEITKTPEMLSPQAE